MIGVLGGIASGKSAVAALLAGPRGRVIDADRLVDEVYHSPEFQAELRREFGANAIASDGRANRAAIATAIFADATKRTWLEGRIHPAVRARIADELAAAEREHAPRVVLDVPLLLENAAAHGLVERCARLVFVDSAPEERDRRAVAARGWKPGEVARREAAQLPLNEKRRRADAVVLNFAGRDELAREVARVERELGLASPTP